MLRLLRLAAALIVGSGCTDAPIRPEPDAGQDRDAGRANVMDARVPLDAPVDAAADAVDAPDAADAGGTGGDAALGPPGAVFTDVTELAGLAVPHRKPPSCIVEPVYACEADHMTGGAAVGDVDGDGWPDLFVTMLEGRDYLYRNRGDGTFEDVTEAAGLAAYALHSNGAAFVDIENDGDLDLYVTTIGAAGDPVNGRYYLFVNDGSGRFTEEALVRGLALADGRAHVGESIAVGDFDRDGYADLHVNEWLPRPGVRPHTRLLRNLGAARPGYFEDVTRSSGALTFSERCWDGETPCTQFAWASAFADLDGDGWQDLVVVIDFGRTRLFWNRGDGTFELGLITADIGGDENGMGSTFGDYDNDGDLDWFVSSIWDPANTCVLASCTWGTTGNRLYRNAGGRAIEDATVHAGVRESGWGWGSAFFDYDNDGDLDLVATNGIEFPSSRYDDVFNEDRTAFWENVGGGRFVERALDVGLGDTDRGKGLVVFDYDRDGDLDVFVANNGQRPRLYRNDGGSEGSFLRVRLRGTRSTSEGLGARVWVRSHPDGPRQLREMGSVTHFLGQSERVAHFGLGRGVTRVAEVEVRWPSGALVCLNDVEANLTLLLTEPP